MPDQAIRGDIDVQTFKPIAMLSILLPVMSGIATAQAPEKAYPNPKTGPGEII